MTLLGVLTGQHEPEESSGSSWMATKEVMKRWRPGSYDSPGWNWSKEWRDVQKKTGSGDLRRLIESISAHGVTTPVLLGDDGRVWDGHHRICIAHQLGVTRLPVRYGRTGVTS